jgi:hypothetical protein
MSVVSKYNRISAVYDMMEAPVEFSIWEVEERSASNLKGRVRKWCGNRKESGIYPAGTQ